MVNYLYQQQCSHLWVSDGSGEIEGVLLRKSRGQYLACPPPLGDSPFAIACAALNVQVRFPPAGYAFFRWRDFHVDMLICLSCSVP